MPSELAVQTAPKWRKKMKKLTLKYLFERIQKIENEYQKKPKIYTVTLHKKYETKAINDLKEMGWKEIAEIRPTLYSYITNEYTKLEKKEY